MVPHRPEMKINLNFRSVRELRKRTELFVVDIILIQMFTTLSEAERFLDPSQKPDLAEVLCKIPEIPELQVGKK